ncbi:MAG: hypothetical protein H7239_01305 [Flavobacterium sp.]|nr:hypothetical protein [Flavobacterium sp.]
MKHTLKSFIFKSLATLPDFLGDSIYHIIQEKFNSSSTESKIEKSENTINKVISICGELNINLKNIEIIEIGSGWFPIIPYFFIYKCKVKKVFTYDINAHYNKKAIGIFNGIFSKIYNETIITSTNNNYNLPDQVSYFPSHNVINCELPKTPLVFSRYVLSHVKTKDIIEMHKKFKNEFAKGTYIIHFISPSDLRQHGDKSISQQDFLKYSQKEWDKITTKYDFHNRLRLPQFIEIFTSLGYEILHKSYERVSENSSNYNLFHQLQFHEDYKKYSVEELTAGNIILVLKS